MRQETLCTPKKSYTEGYSRDGAHIIGGLLSQNILSGEQEQFRSAPQPFSSAIVSQKLKKNYQHTLAFVFAVEEFNKDSHLFPNVSLGFQLYEDSHDMRKNHEATVSILSERNWTLSVLPLPPSAYDLYYSYGRPSYDSLVSKSPKDKTIPNYHCHGQSKLAAVIGALTSESTTEMSNMLQRSKVPQVSLALCSVAVTDTFSDFKILEQPNRSVTK
ncbi:vomeronasal type-2 receptor 26-like [Podarcis lilfordi]|uniref:Vomeronasal type-2 receptor 26-like n=1 Tax=Podarcis lilfordi TaxID=74358 RepID=A0AA35KN59_9SAUR|nr:vomeronasal type-2 receptor 26-like [Podarcis lilfordi]